MSHRLGDAGCTAKSPRDEGACRSSGSLPLRGRLSHKREDEHCVHHVDDGVEEVKTQRVSASEVVREREREEENAAERAVEKDRGEVAEYSDVLVRQDRLVVVVVKRRSERVEVDEPGGQGHQRGRCRPPPAVCCA